MATSADHTLRDSQRALATRAPSVLLVNADPGRRRVLRDALTDWCPFIEEAATPGDAEALMDGCRFDLLIVDLQIPQHSGLHWVQRLRETGNDSAVLLMSPRQEDCASVTLSGLSDALCLTTPFSVNELLEAATELLAAHNGAQAAPKDRVPQEMQDIVGRSEAMHGLLALIRRVAARNSTVLLEGESGTGKEVAARCLHFYSGRGGPFVPVNCSSISPDLLESELFGHVRGAFTGASQSREGLFSHADGGTLFLDEIGEMPLPFQAKLLRVLEDRAIRPVGTERQQAVDVRIVAATNRHLADEVSRGHFREDLFFRLNVLALRLPPLRERPADITQLVRLFSERLAEELGLQPLELSPADLRRLQSHDWPGNVRELKNLVERAMLLGQSPAECLDNEFVDAPVSLGHARSESGYPLDMPLEEVEKRHALRVLATSGGNKSEAARRLGVSRKTLERKIKRWEED